MTVEQTTLARLLQERREAAGYSRARLGKAVGISAGTIEGWELGRVEDATVCGTKHACCRVEAEQIEVAREYGDGSPDVAAPKRTLDRVPLVAGYHLEPARRLRRVCAHVRVAVDRLPLLQE